MSFYKISFYCSVNLSFKRRGKYVIDAIVTILKSIFQTAECGQKQTAPERISEKEWVIHPSTDEALKASRPQGFERHVVKHDPGVNAPSIIQAKLTHWEDATNRTTVTLYKMGKEQDCLLSIHG
jgi:hypothetical protein